MHPLLYHKIPVKVASEWDTDEVGNLQIDYVAHCGRSAAGEYAHTLSTVDIATSWWEAEAIVGRSQQARRQGLDSIRKRLPFGIRELHPDNDTGMINDLLWRYCQKAKIKMSRSCPYKKNDNAWVEQRNWTHVRKVVGYHRLDTPAELSLLRELYSCLRLYKNFFQPTMKLIGKSTGRWQDPPQIRRAGDTVSTPDGIRPVEAERQAAAASAIRIVECGRTSSAQRRDPKPAFRSHR